MKDTLLGLLLLAIPSFMFAQTANVQIIHNCADMAADPVDVYVNGVLTLDNVAFRTATAYTPLPATGMALQIDIAPGNSTSVANSIYNTSLTLVSGESYVVVADGIVSASGYNPSNTMAPFGLQIYNMGQATAGVPTNTDVLVHHGATDAPAVDVVEVSGASPTTLVTNASYTDFAGYLALPTADYRLEVRATGQTAAVASYEAPLATLSLTGQAIVVVASGFLNPANNSNGPAFGLWVALPTGGALVELPASTARAQVIHNSADAAADTVDVYLDGDLLLDDFVFRTATPFVDVPAGKVVSLAVAPNNSTSVNDAVATVGYTFAADETYIVVANGIISATGYNPPNTSSASFDLNIFTMGQEVATLGTNTDVLVHHGATDAPAVDVVETRQGGGTIVTNAGYSDFAGYLNLGTLDYRLEVRATGQAAAVASYEAPLATLGLAGAATVVVASGFLDPSMNSNGPAFGLWVALASGGPLVELPASTARVQVIHNCADAAAEYVDVYLNDEKLLDSFQFRTATPFVNLPAVVTASVDIQPAGSTSSANPLATFNYNLDADETYILVADGIVSGSGYSPGNTGVSAFDLKVYNPGREVANNATEIDVLVHHGSTDAPTVDVRSGGTVLVDDASYGDFAGYLSLPDQDYVIDITNAAGTATVVSYTAPLSTLNLAGSAVTVVASGFLDPTVNSNGPAFGLWVASAAGGPMLPLPIFTDVDQLNRIEGISASVAPNPASNGTVNLQVMAEQSTTTTVEVINMVGQTVYSQTNTVLVAGESIQTLNISDLANGTYWVRLSSEGQQMTLPLVIAQ